MKKEPNACHLSGEDFGINDELLKFPKEIKLDIGLKLQIHKEHFRQYHLLLFDENGNQLDEVYLEAKEKWKNRKTKSGYAIYHNNVRQTGFMSDEKSANIVLKDFKTLPEKYIRR